MKRDRKSGGKKGQRRRIEPVRYDFTLNPRALISVLSLVALTLTVCHGVMAIINYRVAELPWLLFQLFNVDEENNLPT